MKNSPNINKIDFIQKNMVFEKITNNSLQKNRDKWNEEYNKDRGIKEDKEEDNSLNCIFFFLIVGLPLVRYIIRVLTEVISLESLDTITSYGLLISFFLFLSFLICSANIKNENNEIKKEINWLDSDSIKIPGEK